MAKMSKAERRAVIAAELARREQASGVPPELHVYQLRPHHSDEGGPRMFYATILSEGRDDATTPRRLSCDIMDEALQIAIQDGQPIVLALDRAECFDPGVPICDCQDVWGCSDAPLLVFSRRAADALGPLLEPCCQRIPVICPGHDLVGYRPSVVVDALDVANSIVSWERGLDGGRRIHRVDGFAFFNERLGKSAIFTLAEGLPATDFHALVLQPFVDIVRAHGLTGFKFRKIWPRNNVNSWEVPVGVLNTPSRSTRKPMHDDLDIELRCVTQVPTPPFAEPSDRG